MAAPANTALKQPETRTDRTRPPHRSTSIYTTYLNEPVEIIRVLKVLRDQRADVALSFDGDRQSYAVKVLDVSGNSVLLEDIHPRSGLAKMRQGQQFAMSARARGIYFHSGCNRVQAIESERGVPYFRVELPTNVLYQQRRKAARFRLPLRVATNGASVILFRACDEPESLNGRIIDISASGCRAQFDGPLAVPLQIDEKLRCAVSIPEMLEFPAEAIIRHSAFDNKSRTVSCGIELVSMHVTDRRRLEQFLEAIRRMEERT